MSYLFNRSELFDIVVGLLLYNSVYLSLLVDASKHGVFKYSKVGSII